MSDLELIEAVFRDTPNLLLAAPTLIGLLLFGCSRVRRHFQKHEAAIAAEMGRLLKVYVTAGLWTPLNTTVGRQAEAALKARVIIK